MEEQPKTLQDKINFINKHLDKFEEDLGLPQFVSPHSNTEEIRKYLNMSREELEALSPGSCAEIAFIVSNYSVYLQRAYNRELAILNWAQKNLHYNAVSRCQNYKGSFTQQESLAAKDDDYCQQLLKLISQKTLKIDRLQFVANGVKGLSGELNRLQQSKAGKT
jgi:hypothetical protein